MLFPSLFGNCWDIYGLQLCSDISAFKKNLTPTLKYLKQAISIFYVDLYTEGV
jgi:hypothetical protein